MDESDSLDLYIENGININFLCRTCLKKRDEINYVFDIEPDAEKTFAEMLSVCTKLQIRSNDKLPQIICDMCTNFIKRIYKFKIQCERSEKALLNYLDRNINSKSNNDSDDDDNDIDNEDDVELIYEPAVEISVDDDSQEMPLINKPSQYSNIKKIKEEPLDISVNEEQPNKEQNHIFNLNHVSIDHEEQQQPNKQQKRFFCEICDKSFVTQRNLKRHAVIHEGKKFECKICQKEFTQKDNMKTHMKRYHDYIDDNDTNDNQIPKLISPSKLKNTTSSSSIAKTIADIKPIIESLNNIAPAPLASALADTNGNSTKNQFCVHCNKEVACITIHMRKHTGQKPFKCTMCDKAFSQSSDLTYHIRTHTGERPHKCTICGKGFIKCSKLKRHVMQVHNDKRYQCNFCIQTFNKQRDLAHHIRVFHTGEEKPYRCDECGTYFIHKSSIVKHCKLKGHSSSFEKVVIN